jgi:hypothetical protein
MCFSPEADFTAGTIVAVAGVQTLRRVRLPREVIVGSLPLLLGAHQLLEGIVWLWLQGHVSGSVGATARDTYVIFAHAVLPAVVPVGFLLVEPNRARARWLLPFVGVGLILGLYLLWQVTAYPVGAHVQASCIAYTTHTPDDIPVLTLYVIATCGPALLSTRRYLRWFGVLNLIGVAIAALIRAEELTSVWCVYAALVSALVLSHFRRLRTGERRSAVASMTPGPL